MLKQIKLRHSVFFSKRRKQRLRATYAFSLIPLVFKHAPGLWFKNCPNLSKQCKMRRLFLQSIRIAISFSSNRTKFYWSKFCLYLQYYYNIKNLVRKNKATWGLTKVNVLLRMKEFPRLYCFSVLIPFIPIILIIC